MTLQPIKFRTRKQIKKPENENYYKDVFTGEAPEGSFR
jgi:hypothetical protein